MGRGKPLKRVMSTPRRSTRIAGRLGIHQRELTAQVDVIPGRIDHSTPRAGFSGDLLQLSQSVIKEDQEEIRTSHGTFHRTYAEHQMDERFHSLTTREKIAELERLLENCGDAPGLDDDWEDLETDDDDDVKKRQKLHDDTIAKFLRVEEEARRHRQQLENQTSQLDKTKIDMKKKSISHGEKNCSRKSGNPGGGKNPVEKSSTGNRHNNDGVATMNSNSTKTMKTPPRLSTVDGNQSLSHDKEDEKMTKLLDAMTSAFSKMTNTTPATEKFLVRQSHAKDLPTFSGRPEEWPAFSCAYERTTKICGFTSDENLIRLHKCLRGEALKAVQFLLVSPGSLPTVMEILKDRFGQPKHIIENLIQKAKSVPAVKDDKLETLIDFGTSVQNLTTTMTSLNFERHLNNPHLVGELEAKLSTKMRMEWMRWTRGDDDKENLKEFSTWLQAEVKLACKLCPPKIPDVKRHWDQAADNRNRRRDNVFVATDDKKPSEKPKSHCSNCGIDGHRLIDCRKFKNKTSEQRWEHVTKNFLCFGCLGSGHTTKDCGEKKVCGIDNCPFTHHKLLHKTREAAEEKKENLHHAVMHHDAVLLRVIPVMIMTPKKKITIHALCDEGASVSLMDQKLADKLGLYGKKEPLCLKFLNKDGKKFQESRRVNFSISGVEEEAKVFSVDGVRTVTDLDLPSHTLDMDKLVMKYGYLRGLPIRSMMKVRPQLLLGSDNLRLTTPRRVVEGRNGGPLATRCLLGWGLGGQFQKTNNATSGFNFHICDMKDEELHRMVKTTFSTEAFGVSPTANSSSRDDQRALQILQQTTTRINNIPQGRDYNSMESSVAVDKDPSTSNSTTTGRFETGLLWRNDNEKMPDSKPAALMRLKCTERRLDREVNFARDYYDKMNDYEKKGYIRKLTPSEAAQKSDRTWYLPHFGVSRANKPGKIRLVFDAAQKVQGKSLNDYLLQGPDLMQPLQEVLWKFREHRIAFTGDIREMFHQVVVRKEDRQSQRFLWRGEDRVRDPDEWEVTVMTFGATCSPCAATYAITRNAEENKEDFLDVWQDVKNNHYVDDYLGGADSPQDAEKKIMGMIELHKRAGFDIVNFTCSNKEVLQRIPVELRSHELKDFEGDKELPMGRVLGLQYNPEKDYFTFNPKFHKVEDKITQGIQTPTKRDVLKVTMAVYDPLGFIAHFTIKARILLQDIWRSELGWDDAISEDMEKIWKNWLSELKIVPKTQVPRYYSPGFLLESSYVDLHIFSDASEKAFATVAYFHVTCQDKVKLALVGAKSRVAPLKIMSIPRLELQAAVMGARLANAIRRGHKVNIRRTVYWTDSLTVLRWIRSDSKRFKQFVGFRVGEIMETSQVAEWRWVPSELNVADEATRINKPTNFTPTSRWMAGPAFLREDEKKWPVEDKARTMDVEEDVEMKPMNTTTEINSGSCIIDLKRFSSWMRLIRTTARVLRFVDSLGSKEKKTGELTLDEMSQAEMYLIRESQQESFDEDYKLLQLGQNLHKSSRLYRLSPEIDKNGVIVMRGRLGNLDSKGISSKPAILDGRHRLTKLLVDHHHQQLGHIGRETILSNLRQKYWILGARAAVKRAWKECQDCHVKKATAIRPEMGMLPIERYERCQRAFTYTGVDYFGPMEVTVGRGRQKRYGALFTCLSTRAVHIEIAHSLDTDSAIMAIRRFSARRGQPTKLFSDNGTNFHGAERELRESLEQMDQDKMRSSVAVKGTEWIFIPPASPHMGGTWERMVQSVKKSLYAVLREAAPRDEVLLTLMAEAEMIVNSRPLTYVSSDPDDPEPLTPNHFLLGGNAAMTSPGVFDTSDGFLRRQWRKSQFLADQFWKRWLKEYIPTLNRRTKWHEAQETLVIDDIVIIADEQGPRNTWQKGIVTAIYPGKDGIVRVADIRTSTGVYRRPVVKLIRLNVRNESTKSTTSKIEGKNVAGDSDKEIV